MRKLLLIFLLFCNISNADQMIGKAISNTEYGSGIIDIRDHDNTADFLICGWDMTAYLDLYFAKITKDGTVVKELRLGLNDFHIDDVIYSKYRDKYIFSLWGNLYELNFDLSSDVKLIHSDEIHENRIKKIFEDSNGDMIIARKNDVVKLKTDNALCDNFGENGVIKNFGYDIKFTKTDPGKFILHKSGYVLQTIELPNGNYMFICGGSPALQGVSNGSHIIDGVIIFTNDGVFQNEYKPFEDIDDPSILELLSLCPTYAIKEPDGKFLVSSSISYFDYQEKIRSCGAIFRIDSDLKIVDFKIVEEFNNGGGVCLSKKGDNIILLGIDKTDGMFNNDYSNYDFEIVHLDNDLNILHNSIKTFPGNLGEGTC